MVKFVSIVLFQLFLQTQLIYLFPFSSLFWLNGSRCSEASKGVYTRGTLDPICLEAMDSNIEDWVEDLGDTGSDELRWMDVTVPGEWKVMNHRVQSTDDCNDSTNDRGSDDGRGMDINDD